MDGLLSQLLTYLCKADVVISCFRTPCRHNVRAVHPRDGDNPIEHTLVGLHNLKEFTLMEQLPQLPLLAEAGGAPAHEDLHI